MKKQEITATLESWHTDPVFDIIWGFVVNDVKKRFPDGTRIHTSSIPNFYKLKFKKGMKVETLNSVYLLGKKMSPKK